MNCLEPSLTKKEFKVSNFLSRFSSINKFFIKFLFILSIFFNVSSLSAMRLDPGSDEVKLSDKRIKVEEYERSLKERMTGFFKNKQPPCLAIVYCSDVVDIEKWVCFKEDTLRYCGMACSKIGLQEPTKEDFISSIRQQNTAPQVTGIMVMFPLPDSLVLYKDEIINTIDPSKDVECVTAVNLEKLSTPKAVVYPHQVESFFRIMTTLGKIDLRSLRKILVVAGSEPTEDLLFVEPLMKRFEQEMLKDKVVAYRCLPGSLEYGSAAIQQMVDADMVITACGSKKDGFIKAEHVKEAVIFVDRGFPKQDFVYTSELLQKAKAFVSKIGGVLYLSKIMTCVNLAYLWGQQRDCLYTVKQALA